jgi:glycosyltransferase involved in cell wall biosynthesis
MTNSSKLLTVIVPVFNEAENFPKLYKAIRKNIKTPNKIIVVYDFDGDNTLPVARAIAKKDKNLTLLRNIYGKGALNAVKSGLVKVKKGACLVTMADLSDDLRVVDKMYAQYLNGSQLVCASRYMKGGRQVGGPFLKRQMSKYAGLSLYYIRKLPTHDVTNNFKLYDSELIKNINIESKGGFEVAMEITVKAYIMRAKISEVPATWLDRTAGNSNFKLWKWLPSYLHWYFYAFRFRKR